MVICRYCDTDRVDSINEDRFRVTGFDSLLSMLSLLSTFPWT